MLWPSKGERIQIKTTMSCTCYLVYTAALRLKDAPPIHAVSWFSCSSLSLPLSLTCFLLSVLHQLFYGSQVMLNLADLTLIIQT